MEIFTIAVLGALAYFFFQKKDDSPPPPPNPGSNPGPPPDPGSNPGPAPGPPPDPGPTPGPPPTVTPPKGYHAGYPGHYPGKPFCAINYGFKTKRSAQMRTRLFTDRHPECSGDPTIACDAEHEGGSFSQTLAWADTGCNPSNPTCTGMIAYVDALQDVTQEDCINYTDKGITKDFVAYGRKATGYDGVNALNFPSQAGYYSPEMSEFIWYDPQQQTGVYMSGYRNPLSFDASDWEISDVRT